MGRMRGIWALMLVAVGLVWIGQGLGIIRGGSFMIDDIRWAWIGGVTALGGIALALSGRRSRGR